MQTKSTIKNALLELIREKNYPEITMGEITKRGNVDRSILYKHYQSKADVLVDFYKDMFEHLFSGLSTMSLLAGNHFGKGGLRHMVLFHS